MGKGAGSGSRPGLCLTDSGGAGIGFAAPDPDDLKTQLRNARSSVDRAVVLAQWNRDRPVVGESLGTKEEYVSQMMTNAEEQIQIISETEVLGYGWREDFIKQYAIDNSLEYQQMLEQQKVLRAEWNELNERRRDVARKLGKIPFGETYSELETELIEIDKQEYAKDRERTEFNHSMQDFLEAEYGTFEGDNYFLGRTDMQPMLDAQTELHRNTIAEHNQQIRDQYRTTCELMYDINSVTGQVTSGPNWQPQDLRTLEPVLDDHDRAILFNGGLLHDDVAYLSKKRRRELMDGYQYDVLGVQTHQAIVDALREEHPDIDYEGLSLPPAMRFSTPGERPSAEAWYEQLKAHVPIHTTYSEQEMLIIADLAHQHAVLHSTGNEELFAPGKESVWCESEVRPNREEALIKQLIDAGAERVDGSFELPAYQSSHVITPGHQLRLTQADGTVVEYIPHTNVGTEYAPITTLRYDFSSEAVQQQVRQAADRDFAKHYTPPHWFVKINDDGTEHVVEPYESPLYEPLAPGQTKTVGGNVYRAATDADLQAAGHFQVGDRWAPSRYEAPYHDQQRTLATIAALPPLEAKGKTADEAALALNDEVNALEQSQVRQWLRKSGSLAANAASSSAVERVAHPQAAPYSERGQLRIRAASAHNAVGALSDIGAAGQLHEQIPLGLMHVGGSAASVMPPGRLTPLRAEYAAGVNHIQVPDGKMVLHGMTGVQNAEVAQERLNMLIDSGGLLSIAERSRRGIRTRSMSPIGDIASGIDRGVPCSIQSTARHGSNIFFALKPQVLERRDMWFSDRDFGGGEDRYDQYTAYAQSIGQWRIHESPTHAARQKHLAEGLDKGDNEVYFRDGVSLHEIDTIFVSVSKPEAINNQLRDLLKAKQSGKLPDSVKVQGVGYSDGSDYNSLFPDMEEQVSERSARYRQSQPVLAADNT